MRQVPEQLTYTLVGNGRMSQHFAYYLHLLNIPYTVLSRTDITAQTISTALKHTTKLCLLISDDQILDFVRKFKLLNPEKLVHFSGALVLDEAPSAHPLMTFNDPKLGFYCPETYRQIPFIIESNGPAFEQLLPGIPNKAIAIPPEQKPYYHSLCVLGGNFSTLLWQKYFKTLLSVFNISTQDAMPYMNQIFINLQNHPETALTGPLARKDFKTIRRNIQALEQAGDHYANIYQVISELYFQEHTR